MKRVFICSPYGGDVLGNRHIALAICKKAINEGVAPLAAHLFYPQFLDDKNRNERELGIECGIAWLEACDEVWIFSKNYISPGMEIEISKARILGIPLRYVDL